MIKDFAALFLSLTLRVGANMALFILLARVWGPEQFGRFMYLFSIAILLVLGCEFGFTQQILREVGRAPERAAWQIGQYLGAKLWVTSISLVLTGAYLLVSSQSDIAVLLVFLVAGNICASYTDFFFATYRALGHYKRETLVTLQGNLAYISLGMLALYIDGRPILVAIGLLVAKATQLAVATKAFKTIVPATLNVRLKPADVWPVVRKSAPFSAEVAVSSIYMNADTVLISSTLGFVATGVYQAGARFYQGACQLPPILLGLFLPKIAKAQSEGRPLMNYINRLYLSMALVGLALLPSFALLPSIIPYIYTDPKFLELAHLLPWFGLLLFVRYIAAAQGIVMTALNGQTTRVWMLCSTLVLLVSVATPLMRAIGVSGMIVAFTISHAILSLGFWWWTEGKGIRMRRLLVPAHLFSLVVGVAMWKIYI